jgi:hypothetical protein
LHSSVLGRIKTETEVDVWQNSSIHKNKTFGIYFHKLQVTKNENSGLYKDKAPRYENIYLHHQ